MLRHAELAGRLILSAFRGRITLCLPIAVLPGLACGLRRDQSGLPYGFLGHRQPRPECSRDGLCQPSIYLKQAMRASACDPNRRRLSSSAFSVETEISAIALP